MPAQRVQVGPCPSPWSSRNQPALLSLLLWKYLSPRSAVGSGCPLPYLLLRDLLVGKELVYFPVVLEAPGKEEQCSSQPHTIAAATHRHELSEAWGQLLNSTGAQACMRLWSSVNSQHRARAQIKRSQGVLSHVTKPMAWASSQTTQSGLRARYLQEVAPHANKD